MSRRITVSLTQPQAEALLGAAGERLAGEWEAFDGWTLDRAANALRDAINAARGDQPQAASAPTIDREEEARLAALVEERVARGMIRR